MNAIAARWESEQVRLWTGSALAALLVHLVPAVLLVLYIDWSPRPPALAGSPAALDVELASMPATGSPAASSPGQGPSQSQTRQAAATRPQLATVNPVRPLAQMHSIPQPDTAPSNAAPVADAGATGTPVETPDLAAPKAPDPNMQLWEDEIVARLASHKNYPSSALQQMQQDTVTLQFSVDQSGRVTNSRVDSTQHYPALEQEVQQMLQLAGSMPIPPSQIVGRVVSVPVQFSLDFMPNVLCTGSRCPTGRDADSKPKAVAPPPPTLAGCTAAPSPGPAPSGSTATLEQMRAYRESLNQYLAAAGNQLACLSQVREVSTLTLRDTLTRQLHSRVDEFNTEARAFEAKAQAQERQAQQTRQRQGQAFAAQVYAPCTPPPVARPPGTISAGGAQAFRRQLVAYQSAVRSYVACLQKADVAAAAPDRGLGSDQREQLAQTAVQLGDAAIQSFNQVAGGFNAQVPHLQQQALAAQAQQNLAEALVRATAIFPDSSWSVPAPLPADECVRIARSGQTYLAQLCNPTYATTVSDLSQQLKNNVNQPNHGGGDLNQMARVSMKADAVSGLPAEAFQQEAIAAQHGFAQSNNTNTPTIGIAVTTQAGFAGQVSTGPAQQTISYSVSELQVNGRRVSMTISRRSDQHGGTDDGSAVHFDLVLSPDNQTLRGYCWTGQQRSACTLARHASVSGPRISRH
ncbi:MAG TPA: TonB family protein [Steroidobacteraceae bacterium]|jgi:TonB family protein|nr:TonB family protein [Steroidobacteraceae bacterium]